MEQFKIEHFERDNPGEPFPGFATLPPIEVLRIRQELARMVGIDQSVEALALLNALVDASHLVEDFDAASEGFQLSALVDHLDLKPDRNIYLNWDRLLTVDRMEFKDFSEYFDEIWYPSADDIEVFDDTMSWVLFIHHSGTLRFSRFGQ